jgi:elongation factor Ts
MMECKKALVEANGDVEEAIKILRKRGELKAEAKTASRIAADGIVDIMKEGDVTAMIEVNSETDFVAKNASFQEFVKNLLKTIIANKPADVDALMASTYIDGSATVDAKLKEMIFVIGEKLSIRRFVVVEGTTTTYIHGMGQTGVIVKFDADDAAKNHAEFADVVKNVALQIAAGNPPTYVAKEDVPESAVEEELAIQVSAAKNDPKLANKPDDVLKKIVAGKMGKNFFEKVCLVEQPYVKDDSMSVGKYLEAEAKRLGGSIKVNSFVIFEKGEGIQKREENFAEEIAKLTGK